MRISRLVAVAAVSAVALVPLAPAQATAPSKDLPRGGVKSGSDNLRLPFQVKADALRQSVLQSRLLGELLHIHATEPGGQFVMVSHAEPIRAILLHILGLSADSWSRIEIAPASISTIMLDETGGRILRMNMPVVMRVPA